MITYIKNQETVAKAEYLMQSFGEKEWDNIIEKNVLERFPTFDEDKVDKDIITEMLEFIINDLYNKHVKNKDAFKNFDVLYSRLN